MHVQPKSTHFVSLRRNDQESGGTHDRTDSCSQHTREGRRGGHEQRRAHSSSVRSACPTASPTMPRVPGARCSPRGRTGVSSPDNGSAYCSIVHAIACRALGIRHLRTRAYRPQTNDKAERFIRTMLGGWAYGTIYRNSAERTASLDGWLWHYNHHRRHSALGHKPPIARLLERTNPLGTYT
jgi:transposase InsO family protein